jgi:hypothetical protein
MKRSFILSITFLIISLIGRAQNQIDIYESTMKVGAMGTEEYLCGLAEGDQLVFNFEEVNGKELKELEIVELPSSSKFMDYKTTKIVNKTLSISKTAIYKFRFSNSAISGRICKIKIQRIPASDATRIFNTSVFSRTIYDTTYIPTQEKFLIKSDTTAISVVDQVAKVSSQTAMNGNPNKTVVDFTLPDGTISWSYYIGVGTEGKEAFQAATDKFLPEAAKFAATIPGYGTMAALALTGINYFSKVQGADNVKYFFIANWDNVLLFKSNQQFYQYKQGDVVNEASKMTKPLVGKVYLGLVNDNISTAIEVVIKITSISVNKEWETKIVQKTNITSRQELYLKN